MSITDGLIVDWADAYASEPKNLLATNAVCQSDCFEVLLNRDNIVANTDPEFATKMQYEEAKATNQQSTGRCWLFAATNVIRLSFIAKYNLNDFEFSQSYLFFWDKLEKCNYFLESIISTLDQPLDGRLVHHLLSTPINDGGQYDMFVNLYQKYGLVPKSAFPETKHSSNSRRMNALLVSQLRQFAMDLRESSMTDIESLRSMKNNQMKVIYRIMCIFFGAPPKKFDWVFREKKEKKLVTFRNLTPQTFTELVGYKPEEMISLISDPRNEYYKLYTVDFLGNVVGGRPVYYVNVPIDTLNEFTAKAIQSGQPVWFGCDVGKYFHKETHTMDLTLLNYNLVFDVEFHQSREMRLRYGQSLMTHAMVLNAFDGDIGTISKWRVENSWGDKNAKGYALMTNDWFNEYVYQSVIDKSVLPTKIVDVLSQIATPFPPWDPMGSLA